MTTFGLVHGAWHRGTCWDPPAAVLRARLAKERFGARVTWVEGGHCPMLARPEEPSDALSSVPA